MATYKVIQDIEAEDKFVGPLTLKQFVFAMGGSFFAWVCFFLVTKQLAWATILFAPLSLFGFFMAFPWSKEQPTDVWVLAKIRFRIKPKKRIWNQAGRQDLVTITAPKKIDRHLTKDFSQTEVKSRLKALADTIDSRGWVVKHATATEATASLPATDRLVEPDQMPQPVPDNDYDMPDIMENTKVDNMLDQTTDRQRYQIAEKMDQVRRSQDADSAEIEPFVAPPEEDTPPAKNTADRIDELLLSDQIKAKKAAGDVAYRRMSKVPATTTPDPASLQTDEQDVSDNNKIDRNTAKTKPSKTDQNKSTSTVTEPPSPGILNLARNNDLNVATIARQANNDKKDDDNEVVISLH